MHLVAGHCVELIAILDAPADTVISAFVQESGFIHVVTLDGHVCCESVWCHKDPNMFHTSEREELVDPSQSTSLTVQE